MKDHLRYIIIIMIMLPLIIAGELYSQHDSKQVLLNQARRMEARREFADAQQIYEELLEKHPQDEQVISSLFNVLLTQNNFDKAGQILNEHQQAFNPENLAENKIMLYGKQGKVDQAKKAGFDFLEKKPGRVNLYQNFSNAYERTGQFEIAVEVLLLCRENTGDENIFAADMARNYQNINKFDKAVAEYLKHLRRNTGFLYFVTARVKEMLDEDEKLIDTISELMADRDYPVLLQLYAQALSHVNMYDEAFRIYKQLDPEKLLQFADEIAAAGNHDLAVSAYQDYHDTVTDPVKKAQVKFKIAHLNLEQGELQTAKDILLELTEIEAIQERRHRFRTHINREVREVLADIAIRMDKPQENVIFWLQDAKEYAFNRNERRELDLKIVRYFIMKEDYQKAALTLEETVADESSGSKIHNIGFYYKYMLDLMENNQPSDSLLAELIINIPGEELTNEALFLTVMMQEIQPDFQKHFLKAYRLKNIYKDEEALLTLMTPLLTEKQTSHHNGQSSIEIDDLLDVFIDAQENAFTEEEEKSHALPLKNIDEELLLIAAQWADQMGKVELAEALYSYPYQKDALDGYAKLKLSEMQKQINRDYRETVTSFLTNNPQNVLAPKLRLLLTGS